VLVLAVSQRAEELGRRSTRWNAVCPWLDEIARHRIGGTKPRDWVWPPKQVFGARIDRFERGGTLEVSSSFSWRNSRSSLGYCVGWVERSWACAAPQQQECDL
jgi:hypothetical protein